MADSPLEEESEDDNPNDNRFKEYKDLFDNLTVSVALETNQMCVIDVLINARSTHILALCKEEDERFEVQIFSIATTKLEQVVPIEGVYIKANIIEQNDAGDRFAVSYNDNGHIHVLVFDL